MFPVEQVASASAQRLNRQVAPSAWDRRERGWSFRGVLLATSVGGAQSPCASERIALVTASARSLPVRILSITIVIALNTTGSRGSPSGADHHNFHVKG